MEVDQLSNSLPAPKSVAGSVEDTASAIASDFETFLKLLTAQLKNQDPSKPLDSTEFVSQLASFSAVEQQINTNKKLDSLISSSLNSGDLVNWVGAKVKSTASIDFDGVDIDFSFDVPEGEILNFFVVKDDAGKEVYRQTLDPSSRAGSWDGSLSDGGMAQSGSYSIQIETTGTNGSAEMRPTLGFSSVVEARLTEDGTILVFADGSSMNSIDVEAVRK